MRRGFELVAQFVIGLKGIWVEGKRFQAALSLS